MSELLDIITEILLNTFGRIQYTQDLANISLSCKIFHEVAEPLLWSI